MIKVSVIVPVYNVEEYLPKCLDSLVNQTMKEIEIIVVNDGTKDNSQAIIDEYQDKYPDLIVGLKKENGGLSSARNYGVERAKGEYVIFVDSDDWVSEEMVEKLYAKVIENNADVVVCGAYEVDGDKKIDIDHFDDTIKDIQKKYVCNRPSAWCKLIKKDILLNNKLFFLEGRIYEDISVMPSYALFTDKIEFVEESLYYYLIRNGSIMNQKTYKKNLEDIFVSLENLKKIFKENDGYQKFYKELEYLHIKHLLHAASLRFLPYKEGNASLEKIRKIMKNEFPKWKTNKYYKKENIKYKIICNLIYAKRYNLVRKILKIN